MKTNKTNILLQRISGQLQLITYIGANKNHYFPFKSCLIVQLRVSLYLFYNQQEPQQEQIP